MKVISFIEQPSVIKRILGHLDLWEDPRSPPQTLERVCEPCADYVPWQDDDPEIEVGRDFTDLLPGGGLPKCRVIAGIRGFLN